MRSVQSVPPVSEYVFSTSTFVAVSVALGLSLPPVYTYFDVFAGTGFKMIPIPVGKLAGVYVNVFDPTRPNAGNACSAVCIDTFVVPFDSDVEVVVIPAGLEITGVVVEPDFTPEIINNCE